MAVQERDVGCRMWDVCDAEPYRSGVYARQPRHCTVLLASLAVGCCRNSTKLGANSLASADVEGLEEQREKKKDRND